MSLRGRRLKRAVYVLVGVPVVLAVLVVGRLALGPVSLDVLRPSLERALSATDGSFSVRLGATELAWDAAAHEPQLRVRDVRVLGPNGIAVATVPVLALRLAGGALLVGIIAPAEIELLEPRLEIARRSDGTLDLGITGDGPESDQRLDLRRIVDGLAGAAPAGTTVSWLRAFSARGAEITLDDHASGRTWRLEGADVVLTPAAAGLVGTLAGRLLVADSTIAVRAVTRYRPGRERGTVTVRFQGFDAEILTELLSPAPLELRMALDGTVVVTVDAALRPIAVRGHVRGGAGRLTLPETAPESIELTGVRFRGRLDALSRHLEIQRATMAAGISRLHVKGRVARGESGGAAVDARLSAERLPLDALGRWWPPTLAPPARRWVVERLRGGVIRTANVALGGTVGGPPNGPALRPLGGDIAFAGVAVRFDDRFPPVTDVAGTVRLDQRGWRLHAQRGRLGTIELIGATATIPAGGVLPPRTELDVGLRGPISAALAVLDRPPFGYATAAGIVPADVTGTTTAHLVIGVPLIASPQARRPTVTGSARLVALGLPNIVGGHALNEGEIALDFAAGRVQATGTARVAGTAIAIAWNEDVADTARPSRRVTVTGRLDAASRAGLGFDARPWLDGPVDVEAKLVTTSGGSGVLDLQARLDDATIEPGVARLAKRAGVPGSADARLTLERNAVTRVERFALAAGPSAVTGTATRDRAGWTSARLEATVAGGSRAARDGRCTLTVQRQQNGHRFRLTSEDAGALLEVIGGNDRLQRGRLLLEGTAEPADGSVLLSGTLDVRNVVILGSPVLARIATLASLSGIRSALSGAGVPFEQLGAALRYHEPTLSISDGLARGPALAVAVDGTIDRRVATADLRGTAVPEYYGLNTAPARIPVLGRAVGSGKAEGVQAIDFTVTGPLADPRVSVEPVSALAPGALRDLLRKLRR